MGKDKKDEGVDGYGRMKHHNAHLEITTGDYHKLLTEGYIFTRLVVPTP
jgi:hypothetical protein